MPAPTLRDATETDFLAIVALHEAFVQFTSPMDLERRQAWHAKAWRRTVTEVDGTAAAVGEHRADSCDSLAEPRWRR